MSPSGRRNMSIGINKVIYLPYKWIFITFIIHLFANIKLLLINTYIRQCYYFIASFKYKRIRITPKKSRLKSILCILLIQSLHIFHDPTTSRLKQRLNVYIRVNRNNFPQIWHQIQIPSAQKRLNYIAHAIAKWIKYLRLNELPVEPPM